MSDPTQESAAAPLSSGKSSKTLWKQLVAVLTPIATGIGALFAPKPYSADLNDSAVQQAIRDAEQVAVQKYQIKELGA